VLVIVGATAVPVNLTPRMCAEGVSSSSTLPFTWSAGYT
jgi:hypothetical protein